MKLRKLRDRINGVWVKYYPVTIHQGVVNEETDETLDVTLTNIKDDISTKAAHGYELDENEQPKTLKDIDDEKAFHGYGQGEEPKTLKQVETNIKNDITNKANHGYVLGEGEEPKTLKEVDEEKALHGYSEEEEPKTLKEVDDDLAQLDSDVGLFKDESNLKDAIQDSKIKDIENVLSTANLNQSAQLSVSGVSPLSLPKNAANGGMSVKLEGLTEDVGGVITHFEPTGRVRSVEKNLFDGMKLKAYNAASVSYDRSNDRNIITRVSPGVGEGGEYALKTKVGETYRMSLSLLEAFPGGTQMIVLSSNRVVIASSPFYTAKATHKFTFTAIDTLTYIRIGVGTIGEIYVRLQIEHNSTATTYEPYKENSLYLTSPELRSNGTVKDEIRKGANGYELVKRVGVGVVDGAIVPTNATQPDSWVQLMSGWTLADGVLNCATSTAGMNADLYANLIAGKIYKVELTLNITTGNIHIGANLDVPYYQNIGGNGVNTFIIKPSISRGAIRIQSGGGGFYGTISNISVREITVSDGYPFINGGATVIGSTTHYTLATPVITPISYGGILNSAENGTVYHEPIIADAGVYDTKMDILLTDYPIASIEEIIKHENGVDTYLNVASAVVAGDGLSFTHPDLTDGDLVLFTYAFDKESTNGNITATFYDSNVVKIDTETGKAYKIEDVVTNGVLTRTLTEV